MKIIGFILSALIFVLVYIAAPAVVIKEGIDLTFHTNVNFYGIALLLFAAFSIKTFYFDDPKYK
jgi:hypothetical protein